MNLRSVDLNLLVILNALLEERHVSRAAQRLHLSQPATSSALERCRHLFDDALLIRGRGEMRLTIKAEALRQPLHRLLQDTEQLLQPEPTELHQLSQRIRLCTADIPASQVIGPLYRQLERQAPNLDLVVQPWHGADAALDALARGETDLALSVFPSVGVSFRRVELMQQQYCVAMRAQHPAAANFDLDAWLDYPHILVSGRGETQGALDQALQAIGRRRRVGLVVPNFQAVPAMLRDSDLICMLPRGCLNDDAVGLAVFEPPIAVEGFPLHLAWHRRSDQDRAVQFVRESLQSVLREL
ncbi:LysR family transcriptional regulator [Saccharospirillum sp. HFRX-1]|uniref:LysR family transcriptional regulator n=1 Tax=unclassified Saccharospirillum TaxID=2633430 RepID=UPI00371910D3